MDITQLEMMLCTWTSECILYDLAYLEDTSNFEMAMKGGAQNRILVT